MKRHVQPEWLDVLPPDDPNAVRSRCDLRRVNAWMGNHAIMARELQRALTPSLSHRMGEGVRETGEGEVHGLVARPVLEVEAQLTQIVDLGAGDGDFMLRVAQIACRNGAPASEVSVTLLDQQATVAPQTRAAFANLGWQAEAVVADVFDWARMPAIEPMDAIVANLFLHHFTEAQLAELFQAIADRTRLFVTVEPGRGWWPLLCSRLIWAIGCNAVTRHDAQMSVRAGFAGNELSALWPARNEWQLTERSVGPFSHLFVAQRTG